MAERLSDSWPHQLDLLLERLRHDGFVIGVPETVRLHQLLLALVERQVPLESAERLASLLGPVLCRSASEQEAFGRHLRQWWPGPVVVAQAPEDLDEQALPRERRGPIETAAPSPPSELKEALDAVEQRRRRTLRWLPVAPLAGAAVAGLVAVGVIGVQQLQRRPAAPNPAPVATAGPAAKPPSLPPASKPPQPAKPQPANRPPQPQTAPAPQSTAPVARLLPGSEQAVFLLPSELALLTLLAALLSAAAVQGAVRGWWWRQARLVLQRLALQGDPQLHRIALEVIEPDLVGLPELQRIGRALNVWQRLPSAELDATATVEASLRQGGWLTPRYGERRERLSYLFFLDQDSLADQQTRHLRAWLERLRQEGVLADWVCFQREPLLCRGPSGHGPLRRLTELVALHPDAVAVVVADGERFFSPVDGTPAAWIEALAAWPRRLALTPRPQARWGAAEQELQELLPVLPVSVEGLLGLGRWLQGAPVGPLPAEAPLAPAPEPPLLQGSSTPWLDRTPPSPEVVRQLLVQLRAHLGPEGFLWLAACAVFPELHWTITAYLGQRLRNTAGEPLLQHCPLLRLARLPWLRHGVMPDWLRLPLILALDGPQQAAVRQALGQLLLSAAEGEEVGAAQLQVATGSSQRLPRLLPPLIEQLRRRASPASPLHDQLFLRFLQNRPLLAADAPESLRRLLPPRAAGLGPRGLAAATLLLLALGGLGLVAVRQVQLVWIELAAIDQSLALGSGAPATQQLQRTITALGLSRSSLMRLGPDPDLRGVQWALAARVMQWLVGPPLKGHEEKVDSVAYSPDGRQIVSGSQDRTVRVWDAKSGAPLSPPLQAHEGSVSSVAFSPDGRQILSGFSGGTLKLWDAKSGAPLGPPLQGHEDSVYSVAFSPDGRQVLSGSRDRTVRVWDAKSGAAVGPPLRGHEDLVKSVAFSPDGRQIVSGSADRTVRLWDAKSGAPVGPPLKGHEGWVMSVAYSPDGRQIVSGSVDMTVRLWDAKSGAPLSPPLQGHEGSVSSVAFSPDGRQIASGSDDGTVMLWDAKSGAMLDEPLKGHEGAVLSVAFSPDGRQIASGGDDGTVRLWDALSAPEQATLAAYKKAAAVPPWQRTLPIACRRLALHPSLHDLPWLNIARATCRHFTGLPEPEPAAGLVASLRRWLLPAAAAAATATAAALVMVRRRRGQGLLRPFGQSMATAAEPPQPAPLPEPEPPEPAFELRPLAVASERSDAIAKLAAMAAAAEDGERRAARDVAQRRLARLLAEVVPELQAHRRLEQADAALVLGLIGSGEAVQALQGLAEAAEQPVALRRVALESLGLAALRGADAPIAAKIAAALERHLRADALDLLISGEEGWAEHDRRLPLLQGASRGLQLAASTDLPLLGSGPGRPVPMLTLTALQEGEGLRIRTEVVTPEVWCLPLPGGEQLEIVAIPGGEHTIGSPADEPGRDWYARQREGCKGVNVEAQRTVRLERFGMVRHLISQAQWQAVAALPPVERELNATPWSFRPEAEALWERHGQPLALPVDSVSWNDCQEWLRRLNRWLSQEWAALGGQGVAPRLALPGEGQWEAACRAGASTAFHFGELLDASWANVDGGYTYGQQSRKGPYRQRPLPIGALGLVNRWGLAEMHGQLFEWCGDQWHRDPVSDGWPADGQAWEGPDGGLEGSARQAWKLLRGGSWFSEPHGCRAAGRDGVNPGGDGPDVGLRPCCCPSPPGSLLGA